MVDTIYLAGTGPYIVPIPMTIGSLRTGGTVDATWVTASIFISGNSANQQPLLGWTSLTEGWYHEETGPSGNVGQTNINLNLLTSAGLPFVRLTVNSSTNIVTPSYSLNGSTFTNLSTYAQSGRTQVDIYWKVGTVSGIIEIYSNKVLVASFAGDLSAVANVANASVGSWYASGGCDHSQILVTNYNTLQSKVKQSVFNAVGGVAGWTGAYTDINASVPVTTTNINTPTVNAIDTFKAAARTFTNYQVKAVLVQHRSQKGSATSPQNIRPVVRISATNYFGASQALAYGTIDFTTQFTTNPATGIAWTAAEAADVNLEIGVQALT